MTRHRKVPMMSEVLKHAIKLNPKRHYLIAQEAGLHHSTLSKLLNGIIPVHEDDPRVLKIAKVVGVSQTKAFEWRDQS